MPGYTWCRRKKKKEELKIKAYTMVCLSFNSSQSTLLRGLLLPPPLPLGPLFIITPAELGIIIALLFFILHVVSYNTVVTGIRRGTGDEIASVQDRIFVLLYQLPQARVARVHKLECRQPALVLDARVRARLEHHVHQRVAEFTLRLGLAVDPPHGGVERCVALEPVRGVALEVFLVEEIIDNLICILLVTFSSYFSLSFFLLPPSRKEDGTKGAVNKMGDVQCPPAAASWYRWLPITVVVLFRRSEISSSLLPSSVSCMSSTLFRRQASMRISLAEAPCTSGVQISQSFLPSPSHTANIKGILPRALLRETWQKSAG